MQKYVLLLLVVSCQLLYGADRRYKWSDADRDLMERLMARTDEEQEADQSWRSLSWLDEVAGEPITRYISVMIPATGINTLVNLPNGSTFGDLKAAIETKEHIPARHQRFFLNGNISTSVPDNTLIDFDNDKPQLEIIDEDE